MFTEGDGAQREQSGRPPSADDSSERSATEQARVAQLSELSRRNPVTPDPAAKLDDLSAPAEGAVLAELGSDTEPEESPGGASDAPSAVRQRVNLGLDGSIMRQATLAARDRPRQTQRAPRRRPVVLLSHWSEGTVRAVAQKLAPPDGRALLTLEWNSKGQLLSITSSAASSHSQDWQRLAQGLQLPTGRTRQHGRARRGASGCVPGQDRPGAAGEQAFAAALGQVRLRGATQRKQPASGNSAQPWHQGRQQPGNNARGFSRVGEERRALSYSPYWRYSLISGSTSWANRVSDCCQPR